MLLALAASGASATNRMQAPQLGDEDLLALSLEELGNVRVTSVSRRPERLVHAPTSIYVITSDELRRSGVTSLPEALRLAPNLQVARINAHSYAITARGFNNSIGNKLQVLLDGRVLYTPLFSGVFWDTQDVMLEDVERIEVISGPAATLWGANAVNGVINIITRPAGDTQGGLLGAYAGTSERGATLRHGRLLGDAALRLYARGFQRDATTRVSGSAQDEWDRQQAGFRADWSSGEQRYTLQGDLYRGSIDTLFADDSHISGGNLLARWSRQTERGDDVQVTMYYDRTHRDLANSIEDTLDTVAIEYQHSSNALLDGHALVWGAGYRRLDDRVVNAPGIAFFPPDRLLQHSWLFLQDETPLGEQLRLSSGLRIARNSYTGNEILPSLRLSWQRDPESMLWTALSRAVRAPSRLDRELFIPGNEPFLLVGGSGFDSEVSLVAELGYRARPGARSSYSITLFHHDYERLRSVERQANGSLVLGNLIKGRGVGLEAWFTHRPAAGWRLMGGLTLLDIDLEPTADSTDINPAALGNDPRRQLLLRSSHELPQQMFLDLTLRHVGALPNPRVPSYSTLDLRLAWRPSDQLELSLVGRNLCEPRHVEFGAPVTASRIERGLHAGLRWTF
jgi:iron complex outermembrane recepter protein